MPSVKCCVWALLILGVATAQVFPQDKSSVRPQGRLLTGQSLTRRHFADYSAALQLPNGRVDADAMVRRLKELGVNTYYWLVAPWSTWDDLKLFLPKAEKAGIDVWVYLVPPSESPPEAVPPFRLDYVAWGEGIARLSLEYPNLTAWVIDDFYGNRSFFTPASMREIRARSKAINPRLAFLPLMYFPELQPKFLEDYRSVIDGAVVAYLEDRDEIERTWAFFNDGDMLPASEFICPPNTPSRPGDLCNGEPDPSACCLAMRIKSASWIAMATLAVRPATISSSCSSTARSCGKRTWPVTRTVRTRLSST